MLLLTLSHEFVGRHELIHGALIELQIRLLQRDEQEHVIVDRHEALVPTGLVEIAPPFKLVSRLGDT